MEDLPLGRIAALVPEFAVKDLSLDRTLMMMTPDLDTFAKYSPFQNKQYLFYINHFKDTLSHSLDINLSNSQF